MSNGGVTAPHKQSYQVLASDSSLPLVTFNQRKAFWGSQSVLTVARIDLKNALIAIRETAISRVSNTSSSLRKLSFGTVPLVERPA